MKRGVRTLGSSSLNLGTTFCRGLPLLQPRYNGCCLLVEGKMAGYARPMTSCQGRRMRYSSSLQTSSLMGRRLFSTANEIPHLGPEEAKRRLNEFQPVDVRELDEVQQGTLPGAVHISLGRVFRDLQTPEVQALKSKKLLVYCRSGGRALTACQVLAKNGFDVTNLAGGFKEWNK
jgi:rhodanese-related sulfurtransferase